MAIKQHQRPLFTAVTGPILNHLQDSEFRVYAKADEESKMAELLIHGDVGDEWEENDSTSIVGWLGRHEDKAVKVRINSYGGLVYDGIAIYNALAAHPQPTTAVIEGIAASAASVLAMGADTIQIAENASFMLHQASGLAYGNAAVMRDTATILETIDRQIVTTYAARTGKTEPAIRDMMAGQVDGSWLTGREAHESGFADELIPVRGPKAPADADDQKAAAAEEHKTRIAAAARAKMAEAVAMRVRMLDIQ